MAHKVDNDEVLNKNDFQEEKMNFFLTMPDALIEKMLLERGHRVYHTYDETEVDIAIFTGGEDVTPFLYGEKTLPCTGANWVRDLQETALLRSLPYELPKVGICRGAQFLNVHSGGKLWQDVNNHAGKNHKMIDLWLDREVTVTSTHHQMMIPSDKAQIIGVAMESTRKEAEKTAWRMTEVADEEVDLEACFYAHTNSLCVQYHPEYGVADCRDHFFSYVDMLFGAEAHKRYMAHYNQEVQCG